MYKLNIILLLIVLINLFEINSTMGQKMKTTKTRNYTFDYFIINTKQLENLLLKSPDLTTTKSEINDYYIIGSIMNNNDRTALIEFELESAEKKFSTRYLVGNGPIPCLNKGKVFFLTYIGAIPFISDASDLAINVKIKKEMFK